MTAGRVRAGRALLTVSDKRGIAEFARALAASGAEIVSTGATARVIAEAGVPVRSVAEVTGFPEILGGRVKTLHPAIHGGILFRRDRADDRDTMIAQAITPIDLVAVTLYPFEETSRDPAATLDALLEEIDIGGPTLLRAAAKNWPDVIVVSDPAQYATVLNEMADGGVTRATRLEMAVAAFRRCETYNRAIADALDARDEEGGAPRDVGWARSRSAAWSLAQELRYGENPHQRGAFYVPVGEARVGLAGLEKLQGKEISYNNLLDLDAACRLVRALAAPAAVVVKHRNPCGAAVGADLAEAFRKGWAGDRLSAFGGVVALAGDVHGDLASAIAENFVEVVAAAGFDAEARKIFARKKGVRLVTSPALAPGSDATWEGPHEMRGVSGGLLVQQSDRPEDPTEWRPQVITRRAPTATESRALAFAWQVCRFVQSNAIVFATEDRTLGVGSGQTSRVDAVKVAIMKARREGHDLQGSVLASDAFFPFPDSVEEAAKVGCTAIIQPGGSRRDAESIRAADAAGMAMLFTGRRAFRH